jgi:uncharacterized protein
MKWMIASDIHGSAHFCRLLMQKFADEQADRLLLLGDLLYHGPRNDLPQDYDTRETAKILNEHGNKIIAVRGNCDAQVDQAMLNFPILAEYAYVCFGDVPAFVTHGDLYNAQSLPPSLEEGILLYGHTHVPLCREIEGVLCLNPGSVSIPKEASPHSCMTYENGVFTWHDLEDGAYMQYPDSGVN